MAGPKLVEMVATHEENIERLTDTNDSMVSAMENLLDRIKVLEAEVQALKGGRR